MKTSNLKKELKNATVTVKLSTFQYSGDCAGLSAHILVDLKNSSITNRIPPLSAQATDFSVVNEFNRTEAKNSFRSFPKYTGFYSVKCGVEMSLFRTYSDSVEITQSLFSLVRSEIEKKNLQYVSPECELSQFIAALESLGCKLQEVTVNGNPFYDWINARKEAIAAREAKLA